MVWVKPTPFYKTSIMRIIFVKTPHQNYETENPQLIDGKVYEWTVKTENFLIGETLQGWLQRKKEYWMKKTAYNDVNTILIYDIQALAINNNTAALMIRYALKTIL